MDIDGSILQTIKKKIGIAEEDDAFDTDILICINTAFDRLNTLGIGPDEGFRITDDSTEWTEYLTDGKLIDSVKDYVYFSVKLAFDPAGSNSYVIDAIQKQIDKLEFLFNVKSDSIAIKKEKESNNN